MRRIWITAVFVFAALLPGQSDIRKVDFKNFTFPRSGRLLGHDRLMWLTTSAIGKVRLRDGSDGKGFTLQSVLYSDVTEDGREDAIVVLHDDTGGTQQTDYIYVARATAQGPTVLAYCYTGDRSYSGLSRVYGSHGMLVVELFDPDKQEGDCCSTGIVRTRYKWRNHRFEAVGRPKRLNIGEPKVHPDSE